MENIKALQKPKTDKHFKPRLEKYEDLKEKMLEKEFEYTRKLNQKNREKEETLRTKTLEYEERRLSVLQKKQYLEAIFEQDAFHNKNEKERR